MVAGVSASSSLRLSNIPLDGWMDHMSLIHHPLVAGAPVQSTAVNVRGPELRTSVQALNPHYLGVHT